jgi:hypothetical protein
MTVLSDFAGTWAGTNGFRMMPQDKLAERPATASVTAAARGHMTAFAYSWEHPDDGAQEGLLVVGPADESGSLVALWGDSWHQQPAPMSLTGAIGAGPTLELTGAYGGNWGWRIVLDLSAPDILRMRMDNVVPDDHASPEVPAGPYPAMLMDVRRT